MSRSYLLEIGVEELPAHYIDSASKQIQDKFRKIFEDEGINYESIDMYSTPRRLTAIIKGLDERQKDVEENVIGPSKRISYDEEGNPTKALKGFMKGQGIGLDNVFSTEHNGEEYIYA